MIDFLGVCSSAVLKIISILKRNPFFFFWLKRIPIFSIKTNSYFLFIEIFPKFDFEPHCFSPPFFYPHFFTPDFFKLNLVFDLDLIWIWIWIDELDLDLGLNMDLDLDLELDLDLDLDWRIGFGFGFGLTDWIRIWI